MCVSISVLDLGHAFSAKAFRPKMRELASELPFKVVARVAEGGSMAEVFYEGLAMGRA